SRYVSESNATMRLVRRPLRVPWTMSFMSAPVSPTNKVGGATRQNDRGMKSRYPHGPTVSIRYMRRESAGQKGRNNVDESGSRDDGQDHHGCDTGCGRRLAESF